MKCWWWIAGALLLIAGLGRPDRATADERAGGSTTADSPAEQTGPRLILVVGAEGEAAYGDDFQKWAQRWQQAAEQAGAPVDWVGPRDAPPDAPADDAPADDAPSDDASPTDHQRLHQLLLGQHAMRSEDPLWVVLIGHGTYAAEVAKFNLRGPDVSAAELAQWTQPLQRPLVVVNCASASGPFIHRLSGANRVVVTATRSGDEQNYARFGDYLSQAILDLAADLDHDDAVSILEAYLHAASRTQQFYDASGRLATEHPLIDDNGDQRGTPPDFFRGIRAVRAPEGEASVDGQAAKGVGLVEMPGVAPLSAQQHATRAALEQQVERLRSQKPTLSEQVYYDRLEALMVPLGELYRAAEAVQPDKQAARPE